jgi:mannose/fructose/N-acetylgalactosamine-specific phosphotransferase system component IID
MAIALSGVVLAAIIYQTSSKKADLSQLKTDQSKLEAAEKASVLTDQDLRKTFFRSFSSMGSFNFKSYNAMGYLYSIIPCLQKIYKDNPEKLRESYVRNTEFFNTHPYFKNLIIGVSLAMEEENAKNPDFDTKIISSTKTALMGPLAGIGDSVFQGTYRVLFSALGASLAIQGNPVGPWLYFIPNFLLAWGTRWWFLKGGYHSGVKLVERLKESNLFDTFVNMATIVGMMVMAAMTGSFVSLKFKPEWTYVAATETTAAKTISLQGVFDAIMPKLVPLLVVFLMYKVMKKYKGGVYWCLLGTFVVAFVGVAIGLF